MEVVETKEGKRDSLHVNEELSMSFGALPSFPM
jgi:hypothetical protein